MYSYLRDTTLALQFVKVNAGVFNMGLPPRLSPPWKAAPSEQPAHEVRVSAFEISEEPITLHQLCEVLSFFGVTNVAFLHPSTRARVEIRNDGLLSPIAGWENDAARMSWEGAQRFCDLLSKKIQKNCRLPTEAEWEFAAAGTEKRIYPWGDGTIMKGNVYRDVLGANPDLATPNGIQDLNGPVTQWCLDNYDENFYDRSSADNPVCRTETIVGSHAVRGGPMMRYMDVLTFPATWKRFQSSDSQALQGVGIGIGVRVVIVSSDDLDQ